MAFVTLCSSFVYVLVSPRYFELSEKGPSLTHLLHLLAVSGTK